MHKIATPLKNFWAAKKTTILTVVAVTGVTTAALMRVGLNQHDKFLKEHDLYDEYYHTDEI